MTIEEARKLYPHLANGLVHLNHAGSSPLSLPVAGAIKEFIDLITADPTAGFTYGLPRWNSCRDRLAGLLGVAADDIALTKNTAHGISIVADGLKWRDGDEVVFADCEYPSNSYPWLAQQDRGVVCRIVPARADGSVTVDDYRKAMSSKTRVLAVSWVQFSTGWKSDLGALADLAHEFGAVFMVDVIQGLGGMRVDATACGIDIAATGSQKWLMGPVGMGGLYIKPDVLDQIRLVNMGALSVTNVAAFEPLGFEPRPTARRYEEGTPNIPGAIGLNASIELLESLGGEAVETAILNVTRYAMEGLRSRGYEVHSPEDDAHRAGIVLFRHPTVPNSQVVDALTAAKVHVAERGGKVRFSPHYYNTPADLDQALDALP